MNVKNMLSWVLFIWAIVNMTSCNGNQQSNQNNFNASQDEILTISLDDICKDKDTCDARTLIGNNYFYGGKIKIQTDAQIVKAEKITHFYPTIWSGLEDDVIQVIYLFDMEYKDVLPLSVSDNTIEYHPEAYGSLKAINAHFDAITQNQLLAAIKQVPNEYKNKGTLMGYEYETKSWNVDMKVWNKIAKKYTPGEFTNAENEPFEINPYEIELVVTFKDKNGEFTKVFRDEVVIGN